VTKRANRLRDQVNAKLSASTKTTTTRRPPQVPKTYKVVAISLHVDEAQSVDETTQQLQKAGYSKANRSLVIQAAIDELNSELAGKSPEEVVRYFVQHQTKRTLAHSKPRPQRSSDTDEHKIEHAPNESSAIPAIKH
jgi:hypothetical protein